MIGFVTVLLPHIYASEQVRRLEFRTRGTSLKHMYPLCRPSASATRAARRISHRVSVAKHARDVRFCGARCALGAQHSGAWHRALRALDVRHAEHAAQIACSTPRHTCDSPLATMRRPCDNALDLRVYSKFRPMLRKDSRSGARAAKDDRSPAAASISKSSSSKGAYSGVSHPSETPESSKDRQRVRSSSRNASEPSELLDCKCRLSDFSIM